MTKPASFEHAIQELETIVVTMESDELSLDRAISAYERSQELIKTCQAQLKKAESIVKKLSPSTDSDSAYTLTDFDAFDNQD